MKDKRHKSDIDIHKIKPLFYVDQSYTESIS